MLRKNTLFLLGLIFITSCEFKPCCEEELDYTLYSHHAATLLRSYQGSASGRDLPREAKLQAARVAQNLFSTGPLHAQAQWEIFKPSLKGNFTIDKIFQDQETFCLEYQQSIILSGEVRKSIGTACRDLQGIWSIVKETPLPSAITMDNVKE